METARKFTVAKLSTVSLNQISVIIISADKDPSIGTESFAITNSRGVSTQLYSDFFSFNIVGVMCERSSTDLINVCRQRLLNDNKETWSTTQ